MQFRFLPDKPLASLRMPAGQTVLLDPAARAEGASCLEVLEGIARVYCPCEETEGMTLAFLQPGDQLRTDRLCSEGVCVEALTPLLFRSDGSQLFDLPAYREVLFLYSLARDLLEHGEAAPPRIDVLLPLADSAMIGQIPWLDVHWGLAIGIVACVIAQRRAYLRSFFGNLGLGS